MINGNAESESEFVNEVTLDRLAESRLIRRTSLVSNPKASFQEEGIPGAEATAMRKGPRMSQFMQDDGQERWAHSSDEDALTKDGCVRVYMYV